MAKDTLAVGAAGVGLLYLASGIGSLIGNVLLPLLGTSYIYRSMLISVALFALFLTVFAWSDLFWFSWVMFLLVGTFGLAMLIHYTPVRITFGCEGASDGSSPVHTRFPFSRCVPSGSVGGRVELEYSLDPSSWCHRIGGVLVWINAQRGP